MHTISFGGRTRRWGVLLAVPVWVGVLAVAAADAGATLRVATVNDPAGDTTKMTYRLSSPAWTEPLPDFELYPETSKSFGVHAGSYTVQALPRSGWRVTSIECVGPDPAQFVKDVAQGLVTITHGEGAEQTCTFTRAEGNAPPSSGVSPSPPPNERAGIVLPDEIALLGVRPGTGYVAVRLRLIKRSIIKLRLRRDERAIAKRRVVRNAGERELKIRLSQRKLKRLKARGRKRLPVELKAIVAELGGTTKVFRYRVIVPL